MGHNGMFMSELSLELQQARSNILLVLLARALNGRVTSPHPFLYRNDAPQPALAKHL